MKQILVASVSRHVDAREVIRNTKNVFTNGKLCLRSLVAIYDGLTTSVGEGRAMGVIYFCKAFEVLPHNILVSKWERYGFYGWNIKWIRNGQMAVSKGLQSTATSNKWCPSELYWDQYYSIYLLKDTWIVWTLSRFADDAWLSSAVDSLEGRIQRDLFSLEE